MTPGFEPKTPIAIYGHLVEEAGEVLSAIGKILRFGEESYNPFVSPEKREKNIDMMERELLDLKMCIYRIEEFVRVYREKGNQE
jgi:NTP pyrophosphatase (non-canonical NTP hydrolase)